MHGRATSFVETRFALLATVDPMVTTNRCMLTDLSVSIRGQQFAPHGDVTAMRRRPSLSYLATCRLLRTPANEAESRIVDRSSA